MIFPDFFVDAENVSFGSADDFDIGGYLVASCAERDQLAVFYDLHQLLIVVALGRGLEGTNMVMKPGGCNISDDFIDDSDSFTAVQSSGKDLNGSHHSGGNFLCGKMLFYRSSLIQGQQNGGVLHGDLRAFKLVSYF